MYPLIEATHGGLENNAKQKYLFPCWEWNQNPSIYFKVEQLFVFQL